MRAATVTAVKTAEKSPNKSLKTLKNSRNLHREAKMHLSRAERISAGAGALIKNAIDFFEIYKGKTTVLRFDGRLFFGWRRFFKSRKT